jgi:hypothetical protein
VEGRRGLSGSDAHVRLAWRTPSEWCAPTRSLPHPHPRPCLCIHLPLAVVGASASVTAGALWSLAGLLCPGLLFPCCSHLQLTLHCVPPPPHPHPWLSACVDADCSMCASCPAWWPSCRPTRTRQRCWRPPPTSESCCPSVGPVARVVCTLLLALHPRLCGKQDGQGKGLVGRRSPWGCLAEASGGPWRARFPSPCLERCVGAAWLLPLHRSVVRDGLGWVCTCFE